MSLIRRTRLRRIARHVVRAIALLMIGACNSSDLLIGGNSNCGASKVELYEVKVNPATADFLAAWPYRTALVNGRRQFSFDHLIPTSVCAFGDANDNLASFTIYNASRIPQVTAIGYINLGLYTRSKEVTLVADGNDLVGSISPIDMKFAKLTNEELQASLSILLSFPGRPADPDADDDEINDVVAGMRMRLVYHLPKTAASSQEITN